LIWTGHQNQFDKANRRRAVQAAAIERAKMTYSWRKTVSAILFSVTIPHAALAFETPPTAQAEAVLRAEATGPNYRIDPEVRSDGLMRLFVLRTRYGAFDVDGEDLMRERIRELQALRKLQAMSESTVFLQAAGKAAQAPLVFGQDLIDDPKATLQKSMSGVGNMFGRIGAAIDNRQANRDNVATSLLGIDAARRALAVELGVDPYTDFAPLASKLNDVATASALGGLSIRAALAAIPGGAGMAVSSTSTVETIRSTLVEKTSAQIVEEVRATLAQLQVPPSVSSRFVENRRYTPADLLIMARALAEFHAENTQLFIARAVNAETREEAVFQRHRAELLARHAKDYGIGAFIDVGGFPLNRLNDGRVIALFPVDEVSWTERVAGMFQHVAGAAPHEHGQPLLVTTGELTPMAKEGAGQLGWTVEHLR
jgi:hypothetical protein